MLCLFPCSTPTQEVAKNYKIHSIPTFYFIRNGETLESFASSNADKLRDTIKKYYVVIGTPASASA
jgi:thioredoxin 1